MGKPITVAAVGPMPPQDTGLHGEAALDRMRRHWTMQLAPVLADRPDLIVLPEAGDRFPAHTMDERKEYYACRGNRMLDFFAEIAAKNRCHIAYCAARTMPDGSYRNSTRIIDRNGTVLGVYDKNYPTVRETALGGIKAGRGPVIVETELGRIGMLICFDLNFRELIDQYAALQPDLLLFSSLYHGGIM